MVTAVIKKIVSRFLPRPARAGKRAAKPSASVQCLQAAQHGIDKRNVSRHAIKVCEVLSQHGYKAYIVGGAVRDLIVGLVPKDFDVATNATPEQIRPLFRRARIIGRRFRLVHVVFGQEIIETSTFRAPVDEDQHTDEHGRILRDNLYGTHEQDAARRDLSFNALYYDPLKAEVIDFHQGVQDLRNRVVRMIGDAALRYREDPVRMLRALRFAAKLDGQIDPATLAPIRQLAPLLKNVPVSRLQDETIKLLTCGSAMACLLQARELGLMQGLMPQLEAIMNEPQSAEFIALALARTDMRVRAGKGASPSFLFASLLWRPVCQRWQTQMEAGASRSQALLAAIDEMVEDPACMQLINRRMQGDVREIWAMQARFDRTTPRSIWRMLEQPRFRAAVDFLQLRAEAKEVDSVQAQWWMDMANAHDVQTRASLMENWQQGMRDDANATDGPKRTRRRRKRSGGRAQADAPAVQPSDGQ